MEEYHEEENLTLSHVKSIKKKTIKKKDVNNKKKKITFGEKKKVDSPKSAGSSAVETIKVLETSLKDPFKKKGYGKKKKKPTIKLSDNNGEIQKMFLPSPADIKHPKIDHNNSLPTFENLNISEQDLNTSIPFPQNSLNSKSHKSHTFGECFGTPVLSHSKKVKQATVPKDKNLEERTRQPPSQFTVTRMNAYPPFAYDFVDLLEQKLTQLQLNESNILAKNLWKTVNETPMFSEEILQRKTTTNHKINRNSQTGATLLDHNDSFTASKEVSAKYPFLQMTETGNSSQQELLKKGLSSSLRKIAPAVRKLFNSYIPSQPANNKYTFPYKTSLSAESKLKSLLHLRKNEGGGNDVKLKTKSQAKQPKCNIIYKSVVGPRIKVKEQSLPFDIVFESEQSDYQEIQRNILQQKDLQFKIRMALTSREADEVKKSQKRRKQRLQSFILLKSQMSEINFRILFESFFIWKSQTNLTYIPFYYIRHHGLLLISLIAHRHLRRAFLLFALATTSWKNPKLSLYSQPNVLKLYSDFEKNILDASYKHYEEVLETLEDTLRLVRIHRLKSFFLQARNLTRTP